MRSSTYDTGEYVIHFTFDEQEDRRPYVAEITGFSINGQPVSRAALEEDFVIPTEDELTEILREDE